MSTATDPELEFTLGDRIAKVRTMLGLKQAELARRLGVTQKTMARWETDATTPNPRYLRTLAELAAKEGRDAGRILCFLMGLPIILDYEETSPGETAVVGFNRSTTNHTRRSRRFLPTIRFVPTVAALRA